VSHRRRRRWRKHDPAFRDGVPLKVWVDIDNAPHVQIFRPIVESLRSSGAEVEVTARDRTFVPQLLDAAGIAHTVIGRGQPRDAFSKIAAIASRTAELTRFGSRRGFDVAVAHGSRSLPPAARMAGVKNLTMFDYEHVSTWMFRHFCDRILVPRAVLERATARARAGADRGPWVPFDGFKEEIYLTDQPRDASIRSRLGVSDEDVLAVVRPPSRTAHYHDRQSEAILAALTARLAAAAAHGVRTVWLARNPGDPVPHVSDAPGFLVPRDPLDGPSLLAAADLAISGGGTMNREAALLGTPAYSIFTGPTGALDEELIRDGRLVAIRDAAGVDSIPFTKKPVPSHAGPPGHAAARGRSTLREFVVDQIQDLARRPRAKRTRSMNSAE
jgi:predicted glycosyltransferase